MSVAATFYTISSAGYFPGTVALLNSLRLTGNSGELVILDRGLLPDQRARLEQHGRVVDLPAGAEGHPTLTKPFPRLFEPHGVVVLVDSDMIVAGPLDDLIGRAAEGKILLFADHRSHSRRWFAEWAEAFQLRAPLRRQTYVNAGFVVFDVERRPQLLERFWEVCRLIPPEKVFAEFDQPFWAGDQDALNALLQSEFPEGATEVLPAHGEAYPDDLLRVEIADPVSLASTLDGQPVTILHYSLGPKAWQRKAWARVRDDAYTRLMPRLLFGEDCVLRLDQSEVPLWLRPGRVPHLTLTVLDRWHGAVRGAVWAMPEPVRRRAITARAAVFSWLTKN
jgi:hypothetical protein